MWVRRNGLLISTGDRTQGSTTEYGPHPERQRDWRHVGNAGGPMWWPVVCKNEEEPSKKWKNIWMSHWETSNHTEYLKSKYEFRWGLKFHASIWKPDVFKDPSETFAEHQGGSVGPRPLRSTALKFSCSPDVKLSRNQHGFRNLNHSWQLTYNLSELADS